MPSMFQHFPAQPKSPVCQKGFIILCNAHDASTSFLDTFESVRRNRQARGTPTDEEQDLLRAMLLFASAGLDSLAKQLICDALPTVIDTNVAAGKMFKGFVERRLRGTDALDVKALADVVGDYNPRGKLIEMYIADLTSGSLQSTDEILKVGAAFDIPSVDITADPRGLTDIFRIRNRIIHEMDVDFDRPNRNRTPRARQSMVDHTNRVFGVAKAFLEGVDGRLPA